MDLPFLPERMKAGKCEKLVCNLHRNRKICDTHKNPETDTRTGTNTRHGTQGNRVQSRSMS